ncbi:MAG: hypothetical protein IPO97_11080 [Sphingomonadales bacterium]|nr:hypothetical protein [Sphingomonadales bacterium]
MLIVNTAEEIANFCSLTYDVTFPVMAKVEVNGSDADPLYKHLKKEKPGLLGLQSIKWKFHQVPRRQEWQVVSRHATTEKPESLKDDIAKLL